MRRILVPCALALMFLPNLKVSAQHIPIVHLRDLEQRFANGGDTTFVVNLWATWCGPCVKELPYFEALNASYADKKGKVLLVTLDFTEQLDTKVIPFVKQKALRSEVLMLDEANPNDWIPKVSPEWSGAIPATLFVNHSLGIRHFYEGSFAEGELEAKLKELRL